MIKREERNIRKSNISEKNEKYEREKINNKNMIERWEREMVK